MSKIMRARVVADFNLPAGRRSTHVHDPRSFISTVDRRRETILVALSSTVDRRGFFFFPFGIFLFLYFFFQY